MAGEPVKAKPRSDPRAKAPRPKRPAAAVAALCLSALAAIGCPSQPNGPEPPPVPSDAERAASVMAAFEGWTTEDTNAATCSVYFAACAGSFQRRTGYDPKDLDAKNPRAFMANPDPRWLPGWDRLPTDPGSRHVTFGALTLAAAMREHFEACKARFDATELKRAEAAALFESELSRLGSDPNPYRHLGGLVQLRSQLERSYPEAVATRHAMELALFDAFAKANRETVYYLQSQRSEQAPFLRPALSPQEELDVTCSEGLPTWQDPEALPAGIVLTPLAPARLEELERRVKAARDLEARIPVRAIEPSTLTAEAPADPARLVSLGQSVFGVPVTVVKLDKPNLGALAISLGGEQKKTGVLYDCKDADKPDKVGPDGKIQYDSQCKKRDEIWKVSLLLRLADAPELTPQPEDGLVVLGHATKVEKTTTTKKGVTTVTVPAELDVSHVLEIWRRGLLAADYFVQ